MTCSAAHKFIPATRTHRLLSFEEYQKTKSEDPAFVQPPVYCDRHLNHPETFYCDSCETPICLECTVLDHPKPEHRYRYLKEAASEFTEYLSEVTQELKARESEAIESKTAIQQKIESLNGSYQNTKKKLSDHVTRTVEDMAKRIREDGENLARVLNDEYEDRRMNLRAELKQVECIEDSLVHVRDFAERLVRQGNDSYLMSARNEVMSQTQELRKVNAKCQPTQDDYLDFSPSSDFCEAKTVLGTGVGRLQMERPENYSTQSNDQDGMERGDINWESTVVLVRK
ncbi:E3 ubiquitin-protein ligase TRIM33-like [Ptychodera flava]|uniref:E3 ubiquitin-protein ligase TRIM33-like n=1 Tax=Ptychodera flava TaxID=63121 RepID=UPI00396A07EF